ncbi:MAG: hypothetical protein E7K77_06460 [Veillonella parvula]|nr:hypothetical protein [Veillonella parvula]MDU7465598.1 hypothetical protein [Veillonella parvula]
MDIVSVPIRGLFNLTQTDSELYDINGNYVSVPIRGLFNLTYAQKCKHWLFPSHSGFRPHQGII